MKKPKRASNLNDVISMPTNGQLECKKLNADEIDSILGRALNQRTPVKESKVKKSDNNLTKAEIEKILWAMQCVRINSGIEFDSIKQKLNNQLKELI
jgi:hypothetical protein